MMKKLYPLLLILTLIKKFHAFQKFMSMQMTFEPINNEERRRKDFDLTFFLEVKAVAIRANQVTGIIINGGGMVKNWCSF